jgi:hypothetical protein
MNEITSVKCAIQKMSQLGPVVTVVPQKSADATADIFVVQTTAKRLFAADPNRVAFTIVNSTNQSVYLGFDQNVTIPTGNYPGYEILSNGTFSDDHYTGEVWLIVAGPLTSTVSYILM